MGLPDNQSKEGKFSNSSQFYLCSWKIDKTSKSSSSCNLFFFRFFFVFFFFFFFGGRPSERVRMRRSLGGWEDDNSTVEYVFGIQEHRKPGQLEKGNGVKIPTQNELLILFRIGSLWWWIPPRNGPQGSTKSGKDSTSTLSLVTIWRGKKHSTHRKSGNAFVRPFPSLTLALLLSSCKLRTRSPWSSLWHAACTKG